MTARDVFSAQPRVLFVIPGDGHASSMIFVRRQSAALTGEGIETHLFYLGSRTSPASLFREYRRYRAELARIRPEVIHAHFGTVTALFAALFSGWLPLVITYRGSDLNPPPATYRWRGRARARMGHWFSQLAALRARRIICVSRELRERLWWRRAAVSILPTGVDTGIFRPEPRHAARTRLGWSEEELVLLFHAGFDPEVKRLALAQAACEEARRAVPRLRMEILDGSVNAALVPALMNASDCLLVTSAWEGSPTVIQEALACDLPIVSVAVGDVVERLEGVRDSTIASADPPVLGRALARMVNPPRRSDGSRKVPEFCARRLAGALKEIYREAASPSW
jgi:glycosyltransferase involved in cell wall biosynthesis